MAKILKNVDKVCKTMSISQRINFVKLCVKLFCIKILCKTTRFPQTFSHILTTFPTVFASLFISRFFHFSTEPITITIK